MVEPRFKLVRREFELLARRFGPFDEFLEAEREFSEGGGSSGTRLWWIHPSTFNTVGSALRLLGERLNRGDVTSGLVP